MKRDVINVILQMIYFQEGLYVCYIKYFMYSSMLCQFKVHNIVQAQVRVNLPGTFKLSAFVHKLLVFMRHTLTKKSLPESLRLLSSWDLLPRFLCLYMIEFFGLQHLNLTMTLSDLFIQWQAWQSLANIFFQSIFCDVSRHRV